MEGNQVNPNGTTIGNIDHVCGMAGYPTVAFMVVNSPSAGSILPQASIDGQTWYAVRVTDSLGNSFDSITVAGLYRASVSGYQCFRLHPDASFVGATTAIQSVYGPMIVS